MEDTKIESEGPACPFGQVQVEEAKGEFLANPEWKRIYDKAPDGAKRRMDVSFFFSKRKVNLMGHAEEFEKYRVWRRVVERVMTAEDLEYMIANIGKQEAVEHYAALLKDRKMSSPVTPGVKLMSYDDFFAMLDAQGEFEVHDYPEETKKAIVSDFVRVLEGSGDPLETHLEDILATAELKEVRAYLGTDEVLYVRVEVRFLTESAEWSRPYQMLAAWDSLCNLKGYAFPVGKGRRTELPIELESPATKAQVEKRMQLMAMRISA